MKDLFEIGIVSGVHGVKGDIKIYPYTNDPENLSKQKFFIIDGKKTDVVRARHQGKFIIAHLEGLEDRDEAQQLKGKTIFIPRENAAPLPEGQFYMRDIIGCSVYEDGKILGKVDDVMETGANDVYSVVSENGSEILIPALKSVILKIDIAEKRIDVKLPEGLLDDEYV